MPLWRRSAAWACDMRAGRMRANCLFQTERRVEDGAGGAEDNTWSTLFRCRGEYAPERGREQVAAGRLEGSNMAVLRVRACSELAAMTEQARVLVDDVPHQIRSIINPDGKNRMLEIVVEKGVAPHG